MRVRLLLLLDDVLRVGLLVVDGKRGKGGARGPAFSWSHRSVNSLGLGVGAGNRREGEGRAFEEPDGIVCFGVDIGSDGSEVGLGEQGLSFGRRVLVRPFDVEELALVESDIELGSLGRFGDSDGLSSERSEICLVSA
jgi:hypothetical protein